jgi:hypothetical protein
LAGVRAGTRPEEDHGASRTGIGSTSTRTAFAHEKSGASEPSSAGDVPNLVATSSSAISYSVRWMLQDRTRFWSPRARCIRVS